MPRYSVPVAHTYPEVPSIELFHDWKSIAPVRLLHRPQRLLDGSIHRRVFADSRILHRIELQRVVPLCLCRFHEFCGIDHRQSVDLIVSLVLISRGGWYSSELEGRPSDRGRTILRPADSLR